MTQQPHGSFDLEIMAGQAFGNGAHESTRGALAALDLLNQERREFRNILDVGCGSGILALAAAKLWPDARVTATDILPEAVEATWRNAEHNNLSGRIRTLRSDGYSHAEIQTQKPYDLILCNIVSELLIRMTGDAEKNLADGGMLILSGILGWLEPQVRETHETAGFKLVRTLSVGNWRTLLMKKN